MPEVICNTSPLQYLHQVGCLDILPSLAETIWVPDAVHKELMIGISQGVDLPVLEEYKWVAFKSPVSSPALPLAADLGPGESAVLALALELPDSLVILDDGLGRKSAEMLNIPLTGTLGLLIDAKKKGSISAILPILDKLDELGFHVSAKTREAVLNLAGE